MLEWNLVNASFFLSVIALCLTSFIAAQQRILRRELTKKNTDNFKDTIDFIMKGIQEKNQFLRVRLNQRQKEHTTTEEIKVAYQDLKNTINLARNSLQNHIHPDTHGARNSFSHLELFLYSINSSINHNQWESAMFEAFRIEKECRPFTTIKYTWGIDDKYNY